jgi:hypothetical protein
MNDVNNASQQRQESYSSPIAAINQDVRRRNVAAAASFHSAPGGTLSTDPWDEMDATSDAAINESSTFLQPHLMAVHVEFCKCRVTRRRMSSAGGWKVKSPSSRSFVNATTNTTAAGSSLGQASTKDDPSQRKSMSLSATICVRCGKKISSMQNNNTGFAWSSSPPLSGRSNSFSNLRSLADSSSDHHKIGDDPRHAQALLQATPQLRFISPASTDMQGAGKVNTNNLLTLVIQAAVERTSGGSSTTVTPGILDSSLGGSAGGSGGGSSSTAQGVQNDQIGGRYFLCLGVVGHERVMIFLCPNPYIFQKFAM